VLEAALAAALMAAFRAAALRATALATMAFVTTAPTAGFVAPVISLSFTVTADSVSTAGFTIPATGMEAAREMQLSAAAAMTAEAMAASAAAIAAAAMSPTP
jgi:hypothetical protein